MHCIQDTDYSPPLIQCILSLLIHDFVFTTYYSRLSIHSENFEMCLGLNLYKPPLPPSLLSSFSSSSSLFSSPSSMHHSALNLQSNSVYTAETLYVHTHSSLSTVNSYTLHLLWLHCFLLLLHFQWSPPQAPQLHSRQFHSTAILHSHNKSLDPFLTCFI